MVGSTASMPRSMALSENCTPVEALPFNQPSTPPEPSSTNRAVAATGLSETQHGFGVSLSTREKHLPPYRAAPLDQAPTKGRKL
jgi:hypothetical protein